MTSRTGTDEQAHRGRWWLAAGVTFCIVSGAAAGAWYLLAGRTVWTDDQTILRPDAEVPVRRVLWSPPLPLSPLNTSRHEYEPSLSDDEGTLYFVRGLPGQGADIYVSRRREGTWTEPAPLAAVNTPDDELGPRLTPDGRFLLFYSDRPGGCGQYDIWAAEKTAEGWGKPFNLGPTVNSPYNEYGPALGPEGRCLYYASNRKSAAAGGTDAWQATIRQDEVGDYDLFVAEGVSPPASAPATSPGAAPLAFASARELEGLNTPHHEGACCVSPGGDFLYFASNRPGGFGGFDLYRCRLRDGECEPPENLGRELNTDANETDPQLALGGFALCFSSDRPGRGGYDLFRSESREVYALRERPVLPALGWHWWALLAALAALAPLLLFLRAAGYRHLSLLQKCAFLSLLLHVLVTGLLSLVFVSVELYEYVAREAGMITAVNLDIAREVELGMQVRQQITDLPLADASLSDLRRVETVSVPRAAPVPAEMNVPRPLAEAAAVTVRPVAPPTVRPEAAESLSLPPPRLQAEEPVIRVSPPAPVHEAEAPVRPQLAAPVESDRRPAEPPIVQAAAREAVLPASPVRPNVESPARPAAPERLAEVVEAERPRPEAPAAPIEPVPVSPAEVTAPPVSARPATPEVPEVKVRIARTETASPQGRPSLADAAVPAAQVVPRSLVVSAVAAPAPTPKPPAVALDIPPPAQAPEVTLPTLATPRRTQEQPAMASGVQPPRALEPRPLSPFAPPRPADRQGTTDALAPVELAERSLAHQPIAEVRRPRPAEAVADRVNPQAPLLALPGSLGPGRLTSPESLLHRSFEQRQRLVNEMGGSKESEEAVAKALVFLSRTQGPDGRWSHADQARAGRRTQIDVALTGLASLCFLAGDHTPAKPGPYQESVRKALDLLLAQAKPGGDLRGPGDMYSQAIATLALAEAGTMTRDARYRDAAIEGARFILKAQNTQTGGWRYEPADPGDTSVLGWQVMALYSVERLGVKVPEPARKLAFRWLDGVSKSPRKMLAGYQGPAHTQSMTAEAVFSRIILGQNLSDAEQAEACDYLLALPPDKGPPNYYYWYYATLALMQMQNDAWNRWNPRMRDLLIRLQHRGGSLDGSWDPTSKYGQRAGRIYTTTLATLTLEVYYRYLPMYALPAAKN